MSESNGPTITYDYDNAYRLIDETYTESGLSYTTEYRYDEVGNRTQEIKATGDIWNYSYNQNDQLTQILKPNNESTTYEYDARGNLTYVKDWQGVVLSNTTQYQYDARDQLIEANLPSGLITYDYDHNGNRILQFDGINTTNYLWDEFSGYGDVVLETDDLGAIQMSYTLANGTLLSQTDGLGTTSYLLDDAQNSTRLLTDSLGAITDSYSYDAFGNLQNSPASLSTNYLYTGQQYDPITELYSLRARYYDPAIGRFNSRDTWPYDYRNPVELNRYTYAMNNPLMYADPSGNSIAERALHHSTITTVGTLALTTLERRIATTIGITVVALALDAVLPDEWPEDLPDIRILPKPEVMPIDPPNILRPDFRPPTDPDPPSDEEIQDELHRQLRDLFENRWPLPLPYPDRQNDPDDDDDDKCDPARAAAYVATHRQIDITNRTGIAYDYQRRILGNTEYEIAGGGKRVEADGVNVSTCSLLDAKHVDRVEGSYRVLDSERSLNLEATRPELLEAMRNKDDDLIERYGIVLRSSVNPFTNLVVIVNEPRSVSYWMQLLTRYAVPRYHVEVIP